ncbi:hypothetical protein BXZ70DRAFT_1067346 [Cristinia sonorae]|uniref:F-box domain-containing protein n=1 Tax=Cristinia sonorae TaxID=1940300 RepID=A0A8K0XLM7_9AGAR|nr:hypothetical protein BXZ70DRAFT_1067346 [Cristinia sonorae]
MTVLFRILNRIRMRLTASGTQCRASIDAKTSSSPLSSLSLLPWMHKVFLISELLESILQHVADTPKDHVNTAYSTGLSFPAYNAVTALTQTARIFRQPTLKVLWHTQFSLVPLFKALGMVRLKSTKRARNGKEFNIYEITRQFTLRDLDVFYKYSSMIVKLCMYHNDPKDPLEVPPPRIVGGFSVDPNLPRDCLFPKLREFMDQNQCKNLARFVMLTSCKIDTLGSLHPVGIMDLAIQGAPKLTSLTLDFDLTDHWCGPNLSILLRRAPLLTEFKLTGDFDIDDCIWQPLSQLPLLNSLEFKVCHVEECTTDISKGTFQSLVTLEICIFNIDISAKLFSASTFPHLQTLKYIDFSCDQPTHEASVEFFSAFAQAVTCPLLHTIKVVTPIKEDVVNAVRNPWNITSEALRPLLKFRQLRQLKITPRWCWDLDDDLICDMARAWPHLTILRLDALNWWPSPSRITARGLDALSQSCHSLRVLDIVFDGTRLDVPVLARRNRVLDTINVGCSILDSPKDVVACLTRVFPNVRTVYSFDGIDEDGVRLFDSDMLEGWRNVQRLLDLYSQFR